LLSSHLPRENQYTAMVEPSKGSKAGISSSSSSASASYQPVFSTGEKIFQAIYAIPPARWIIWILWILYGAFKGLSLLVVLRYRHLTSQQAAVPEPTPKGEYLSAKSMGEDYIPSFAECRKVISSDSSFGTHGSIVSNGVKLHYVTRGKGPLLLLLHGFPQCWYAWRVQLVEFSDRYTVVAPDLRGYGDSDKPENITDYSLDKLVEDVRMLIVTLKGQEGAVVCAHDWGGLIAWKFATTHPQLTRKLMIFNAPYPLAFQRYMTAHQLLCSWYISFFQLPIFPELLMKTKVRKPSKDGEPPSRSELALGYFLNGIRRPLTPRDKTLFLNHFLIPGVANATINYYRAFGLKMDSFGFLTAPKPEDRCPVKTFVAWADKDIALDIRSSLGNIDEYFSDITVKTIPGCGHFVLEEEPKLCNDLIRDFLAA